MSDFSQRRRVMVDSQVRPYDVTKYPIIDAMLRVPRERFVPNAQREVAYMDDPVSLGGGRSLLAPRVFARMVDVVGITKESLVLVVGAGMGYGAAIIAQIAEAVVALEEDATLVGEAETTLAEESIANVVMQTGDLTAGAAEFGPYDVIFVEGGVEQIPAEFEQQLADQGRIIAVFMDGPLGKVHIGVKADGVLSWRYSFDANASVLPGFEKTQSFKL